MVCTLEEIVEALYNGEVVGIPTDTVYGFATLKEYSPKIYELKKRSKDKKLITFINTIEEVGELDEFTYEELGKITKDYWPGNNTLIFLQKGTLVSYRMSSDLNIINLLKKLNTTLLTTSANLSGDKPCLEQKEFLKRFPNIKLLEEKQITQKFNRPSNVYIIKKEKKEKIR